MAAATSGGRVFTSGCFSTSATKALTFSRSAAAEREKVSAFVALVEKHPDVKTLPPEVAAAIDQGAAPLAAYESYLLAQKLGEKDAEIGKLQTELAALKADKNNRTTAPGSAKGMAEEPEDNNPLWRGWDSV